MAPAIGVESTTLLPAPLPLDVAMPATATATLVSSATAAGDDGAHAPPPGGASTALKLADCIGRVSAALAELGATVEALKGKERRGINYDFTMERYFLMMGGARGRCARDSLVARGGGFRGAGRGSHNCCAPAWRRLPSPDRLFSFPNASVRCR